MGLKIREGFISSDYSIDRNEGGNEVDDSNKIIDIGRQTDLKAFQLDENYEMRPKVHHHRANKSI